MRIGIVTDVSQAHRKWMDEAIAEAQYQDNTVTEMERVLSDKYDLIQYVYDDNLIKRLKEDRIDLVFNLSNGYHNHQDRGELPELLDREKIPYTGSNALGHRVCDDKSLASLLFEKNSINTPKTLRVNSVIDLVSEELDFPLLVKPNNEGSGRGITNESLVYSREELEEEVKKCLQAYTPPILVTEYIDGSEITLGILGFGQDAWALTPLEIDFSRLPDEVEKIYSFEVKHQLEDMVDYNIPPKMDDTVVGRIQELGLRAFRLLGLRDYARIDMRVRDGIPYILEINSLAGLNHESSDIVKTAAYEGLGYFQLLDTIIQGAMKRQNVSMNPKEESKGLDLLAQTRRRENERARKEDIEDHKKSGNMPLKADQEEEGNYPTWTELEEEIKLLESSLILSQERLVQIKKKFEEMREDR